MADADENAEGGTPSRAHRCLAAMLLLLAVGIAYSGSLQGPFVFDDVPAIVQNPTLRSARDLAGLLAPPGDQAGTVGGRPVLNASFALNFASGGIRPVGYHAVNIGIHAAATLLLFGVIRRTLARRARVRASEGLGEPPDSRRSLMLAFFSALLWAVHPLQTESVTYVVQRAESLMGLLYLLTLYSFVRFADRPPGRARGWALISVSACLLGMATKETMVSAPLVVFLYDRTFVSGSFRRRGAGTGTSTRRLERLGFFSALWWPARMGAGARPALARQPRCGPTP